MNKYNIKCLDRLHTGALVFIRTLLHEPFRTSFFLLLTCVDSKIKHIVIMLAWL